MDKCLYAILILICSCSARVEIASVKASLQSTYAQHDQIVRSLKEKRQGSGVPSVTQNKIKLKSTVAEFNGTFLLDEQGSVRLPYIGVVKPKNIKREAMKLYRDIEIETLDPNLASFFVVGQSKRKFKPGLTLAQITSETAFIKTADSNLPELDVSNHPDFPIFPGDAIRIESRRKVLVAGEVQKPGVVKGVKFILEAVSSAGGFTSLAQDSTIVLIRPSDKTSNVFSFNSLRADNSLGPVLRSGDVVVVAKSETADSLSKIRSLIGRTLRISGLALYDINKADDDIDDVVEQEVQGVEQ